MWYDVLLDALRDTAWLFPFLLLLYILVELMEHNTRVGKPSRALSGKWAPLLGTATGIVPMCGFSVMAAKLWKRRHITLGTLLAVFIATSDEAVIVLLLSSMPWADKAFTLLGLLGSKLVLGIAAGYVVDLLARRSSAPAPLPPVASSSTEELLPKQEEEHCDHSHEAHEHHEEEHSHSHEEDEDHEHGHCGCAELSVCEHKKTSTLRLYLLSPLVHALEVAAFVLLVNLAFGFLFFALGEDKVIGAMQGTGKWLQPLVCPLIGLIPNCASSVALAEVYALGGIGFGGLLGGLVTNAGLGYLALFGKEKRVKAPLLIAVGMLLFGIAIGYVTTAIELIL